jgi:epsin
MTMPIRRTIKNVVKNYSDCQVKVREATSNDPWGPSSTLMSEIADLTYNVVAFTEIMQMIWKRLNDHGKNWRHVYKSLVLLDYIIKTGSEKVAQQCKENIFAIQTLKDFQYIEDNKDQGMNVREKAKQLVSLLKDDERLKNERAKALKAKERFAQNSMGIGSGGQFTPGLSSPTGGAGDSEFTHGGSTSPTQMRYSETSAAAQPDGEPMNPELESARPSTAGEEELQLQLALAMSKEEHDEDMKRRRGDEVKLQMAIEESKKEDFRMNPSSRSAHAIP